MVAGNFLRTTKDDTPAIHIEDLTRRFGDNIAVNRLSFEVAPGEVFGLLGHNGAGKTTTIRLLNGVLDASEGQARVLGFDPVGQGSELRRRTGVLTENPSLDENLTARENLSLYADLYDVPPAEIPGRMTNLLERFELAGRADDKAGSYSKGMKQRLALARALLHQPTLLFLDEPTSGLDPVAARDVRNLIIQLSRKEGRTVVLCTHNLVEAQRLCDRVIVLEHGKALALGTPAELGARFGGRQAVEIEVSADTMAMALDTLETASGLDEVAADRETLKLSKIERQRIPDLIAQLAAAGVRIFRVTTEEPSLEDIYFALHEKPDSGAETTTATAPYHE
jgi:ABC-2 type transport system ATP-binding protein